MMEFFSETPIPDTFQKKTIGLDDNFSLFGRDQGIDIVELDTDSESESEKRSKSRSNNFDCGIGNFSEHQREDICRESYLRLSSISKDGSIQDSDDSSEQMHLFSNFDLGSLSSSPPLRKASTQKNKSASVPRGSTVLTPEEKKKKREEALRRREECQLSVCTFR
jgi:hypothetical protein